MAVFCVLCDDNVNIRIHRRAGSRVRLDMVRERTCIRLSCTGPATRPNATLVANVASTSPLASLAAAARTNLSNHDRGVTTAAVIESCEHVRETRSAWIAGRL